MKLNDIFRSINDLEKGDPLSIWIQTGVELGAVNLAILTQQPNFFCPAGLHYSQFAIHQQNENFNLIYCPDHLSAVIDQISKPWPQIHTEITILQNINLSEGNI